MSYRVLKLVFPDSTGLICKKTFFVSNEVFVTKFGFLEVPNYL